MVVEQPYAFENPRCFRCASLASVFLYNIIRSIGLRCSTQYVFCLNLFAPRAISRRVNAHERCTQETHQTQ